MPADMQGGVAAPATDSTLDGDRLAKAIEQEIVEKSLEMPLLPAVAAEVLATAQEEEADVGRLADLIQQDQALASHLLRVVNSPAFRGSTEIVTLQQAIARLGLERLGEIALSVSLKGSLFKPGPFDALLSQSWHHSLRTALWSKEIARIARKNVEVAYLCGLLHRVGLPLIVNRASELDAELSEDRMQALVDAYAQPAGIMLMEEWGLPSAVSLVIRFLGHFDEAQNAVDVVATVDAGVAIARAHVAALATASDPEDAVLDQGVVLLEPAMQHLNFYPDDVALLLEHTTRIHIAVEGMA